MGPRAGARAHRPAGVTCRPLDRRSFLARAGVAALAARRAARRRSHPPRRRRAPAAARRRHARARADARSRRLRRRAARLQRALRRPAPARRRAARQRRRRARRRALVGAAPASRSPRARAATPTPATRPPAAASSLDLRGIALGDGRGGPAAPSIAGAGAQLIDVYARSPRRAARSRPARAPTSASAGWPWAAATGWPAASSASRATRPGADDRDRRRRGCAPSTRNPTPTSTGPAAAVAAGNFGVVTSLTLQVTPVRRAAYFFASWPWSQAADAVAAWQRFAPDAPDALMSILSLATGGSQPDRARARAVLGHEAALARVLAPLRAAGATITTGSDTYLRLMLRWAGCLDGGVGHCHIAPAGSLQRARFAAKSQYVARNLPAAGIRALLSAIAAPAGDEGRRLRRAAARRLRRRHQPRGARRHGLRAPRPALLDPGARLLGRRRGAGAAAGCARPTRRWRPTPPARRTRTTPTPS